MRVTIGIFAILVLVTVVYSYPNRNYQRLQMKRGFGDRQMSTARSFGKRQRGSMLPDSTKGIRVEWLADHLYENPTLAQKVISLFLDIDGDDTISPEELYAVMNESSMSDRVSV